MAAVNAALAAYSYSKESSYGTASATWKTVEPNPGTIKNEPTLKSVARTPISKDRQDRPGSIVGLDGQFEMETDCILETFVDWLQAAVCSVFKGSTIFSPTAAVNGSPSSYTVPSGGAITAASGTTLVYARGFSNSANNGIHTVAAASTGTSIKIAEALVNESPATIANATVEMCGIQGASGDITQTTTGLASTVLDFTTLPGFIVGAYITIGDKANAAYSFALGGYNGLARITSVATHAVGLDRTDTALATDAGTSKTIRLMYGRWVRPVARDNADASFPTYTFEEELPDLISAGNPGYAYAIGAALDQLVLTIPLEGKATVKLTFKAKDNPAPVAAGSRKSGASTPLACVQNTLIASVSDVIRVRLLDASGTAISTDGAWFQAVTITIRNNPTPHKFVGTLGAGLVAFGRIGISIQFTGLLDSSTCMTAARNNTSVGLSLALNSVDGAIIFDFPSMKLTNPTPDRPDNDLVSLQMGGATVKELALYPYVMSATLLPYRPLPV